MRLLLSSIKLNYQLDVWCLYFAALSMPELTTAPRGSLFVNKGQQFINLVCEASGVPQPVISWYKNGNHLLQFHNRSR